MNRNLQDYLKTLDQTLENKSVDAFSGLKNAFAKIESIEAAQTEEHKFNFLDKSEYLVFSLFLDETQLYQENGSSLFLRKYTNEINESLLSVENHKEEVLKYWRERLQTVKSKILKSQYLTLIVKYSSESSVNLDEVKMLAEANVDLCPKSDEKDLLNWKLLLLSEYLKLALFFSERMKEGENSFFSKAFDFVLGFLDTNKDAIAKDGWKYYWDMAIEFLFTNHKAPDFLPKSELAKATQQFEGFVKTTIENFPFSLESLQKIVEAGKASEKLDVSGLREAYNNEYGFRFLVIARESIINIRKVKTTVPDLKEQLQEAQRLFLLVFRIEFYRAKRAVTHWFEEMAEALPDRSKLLKRPANLPMDLKSDTLWIARNFLITPDLIEVPEKFSDMPPFLTLINKYVFNFDHPESFKSWVTWAVLLKTSSSLSDGITEFKKNNKDPRAFYEAFLPQPTFNEWTKGAEGDNILKKAIDSFWANDYVLFYSLVTAFFEEVLRNILIPQDGNWLTFFPPNRLQRTALGGLLNDRYDVLLINKFFKKITPDIIFHLKIILIQNAGFSLRNILAHGAIQKTLISPEDIANWFFQLICVFSFSDRSPTSNE